MAVVLNNPVTTAFTGNHYEGVPVQSKKSFEVKNVDDKGRIIHYGSLEVNDSEIVFRYEHHPAVSKWPLNCIRRYGVSLDGGVFALEAGRRAPDGEGLYAFKTIGNQACEIRQRVDYYTHHRQL